MTLERAVEVLNERRHRDYDEWEIRTDPDGVHSVIGRPLTDDDFSAWEAKALAEALSGGWVPVGERLPEQGVWVQAWSPLLGWAAPRLFDGHDFWLGGERFEVTHWAEMLSPPGEEPTQ